MVSSSSATSGGDHPTSGGSGTRPSQQAHAEWAASMQPYYAASAAGHPYVAWPAPQQQQCGLMTAGTGAVYGAPVPFPLYHHPAAAYYAHASMAAGAPHMAGSAATKGKRKTATRRALSGEGASSSGSGDAGSQGSSEEGAAAGDDHKGSSSTKRRKSGAADTEGEPSQAATMQSPVTEPALVDKGGSASKLSASAAAALPNAALNLNVGMDPRSTPPSVVTPSGQGEVNAAASSQSNGSLSLMDERELKRERRKQSNRDSARRSRLRKQQECEELAQKASDLTTCNNTLRLELEQLKEDCKAMEEENTQLMEEMGRHDDRMSQ